jgi:hypothetical protein
LDFLDISLFSSGNISIQQARALADEGSDELHLSAE